MALLYLLGIHCSEKGSQQDVLSPNEAQTQITLAGNQHETPENKKEKYSIQSLASLCRTSLAMFCPRVEC